MRGELLLCLALLMPSAAQSESAAFPQAAQQEKPAENAQGKPTVLSGAALRLGAELETAAQPSFLKWARNFAKRNILKGDTPPAKDVTAKGLSANYQAASPPARQAGEILVWYLAYQEGTKSQEIAAQRVRDLEKEMARRRDDLRQLENTPVPMHQLAALHAAQEQIQSRLEQDGRMRDAYNSVLDSTRARVDVCLENLFALTEAAKGLNTAEIRSLK